MREIINKDSKSKRCFELDVFNNKITTIMGDNKKKKSDNVFVTKRSYKQVQQPKESIEKKIQNTLIAFLVSFVLKSLLSIIFV